jgi:heme oxygenase-like protein
MNSLIANDGITPSIAAERSDSAPAPIQLTYREAYYHLVNVEEHPEILPLAHELVTAHLRRPPVAAGLIGELSGLHGDPENGLSAAVDRLAGSRAGSRPWASDNEDLNRRRVMHYFVQYMPTAFVDGCWLQCGLRVSTAHTLAGSLMTEMYAHQVGAFIEDPARHFVADYRSAYERLGAPIEEIASRSFAERHDFLESSLAPPVILLALAQFTRNLTPEILGLNLAWQFLDLSAFGPLLIRDVCRAYALPALGHDLLEQRHLETGREMAHTAVHRFLESADASNRVELWDRVLNGAILGVELWSEWLDSTRASAPCGPPDPQREMLDLLWRKAPHAAGYHADKRLGARRIDEQLDPRAFDGPALLDELSRSRWVRAGQSERSGLLRHLVKFGGPMLGVFSPVELEIIQRWIDSLPPKHADGAAAGNGVRPVASESQPTVPTVKQDVHPAGRAWSRTEFRRRSETLFGSIPVRELFYYLVNVERYPHILPVAEQFAQNRLERSMAMLFKGERAIPSRRYDPAALERWVYRKHRDQVDAYKAPGVRPLASKEAFIEVTVQLAPIILIDGGWLQGIASPALIHTVVGRMLFHVLVEEIGAGKPEEHHANIYRELLASMGEAAPPVESWDFARWARLKDESFDVPTLWLSMSCFPRHFLPEIIGLNLAVELAGIGGPYLEARDTLRHFGFPTLFVDVHNAADNVAAGHSAWAMNTIKRYMDEVAEREGPHNVDRTWHRVWSGMRATLPQIGRLRLMLHRIGRRVFGENPTAVPLIFPS